MSHVDSSKAITHLSVCAGYGGIDLGLRRVVPNLRTVAFCEIEAFACANLVSKIEAGFLDAAPIWTNLKTFPWGQFRGKVDILSGGYPCQPFSAAGKRLGKEDPRHLWPWIADGIAAMRPGACFFENVDGHISLGLPTVISDLEELGYKTAWGVFSAAEVGAPHQRKRVFILAVADEFVARLEGLAGHVADRDQPGRVDAEAHRPACEGGVWPACPGEPQYRWEPPRVVGNAKGGRPIESGSDEPEERRSASTAGPTVGHASLGQDDGREPGDVGSAQQCGQRGDDAARCASEGVEHTAGPRCDRPVGHPEGEARPETRLPLLGTGREDMADASGLDGRGREPRTGRWERGAVDAATGHEGIVGQTQSPLGRDPDGPAGRLDYAKLCQSCDSRTDELRLLGNGVVPATAAKAFVTLMKQLP